MDGWMDIRVLSSLLFLFLFLSLSAGFNLIKSPISRFNIRNKHMGEKKKRAFSSSNTQSSILYAI